MSVSLFVITPLGCAELRVRELQQLQCAAAIGREIDPKILKLEILKK